MDGSWPDKQRWWPGNISTNRWGNKARKQPKEKPQQTARDIKLENGRGKQMKQTAKKTVLIINQKNSPSKQPGS